MWFSLLAGLVAVRAAAAPSPEPPRIEVRFEPTVELAGATRLFGGGIADKSFQPPPRGYAGLLRDRITRASALPALERASALAPLEFSAGIEILARLGALRDVSELPNSVLSRGGGAQGVRLWLRELEALRAASGTPLPQDPGLSAALRRLRDRLGGLDLVGKIEAYSGARFRGGLLVWPTSFLRRQSMLNAVTRTDGGVRIVSVLGGGAPLFGSMDFWNDLLPADLWHELGHGILDELVDLSSDELARRRPPAPYSPCYGDWRQCVKEHAARALMLRLVAADYGEGEARRAMERALRDGSFPYLPAMVESLRAYEASRQKFPSLEAYFPRLLASLPPPDQPAGRSPEAQWVAESAGFFPTPAQARAALGRLAGMDPAGEDPNFLYKRGALLLHLGKLGEAEREARRVLATRPAHPGALRVLECVDEARRCREEGCQRGTGPEGCGQLMGG